MKKEQTKYLFKDIDFIDIIICRLNNQIQKSKYFCILLWLGAIGFLVSNTFTNLPQSQVKNTHFSKAMIPIIYAITISKPIIKEL